MNVLALDCCTQKATIALYDDASQHTQELEIHDSKNHAKHILSCINKLLTSKQLTQKDLTHLVVGIGPGSFTGLRVACSIIKGLAYALDIPVYPVTSLDAMAFKANIKNRVLTMLDARMNEVYFAVFNNQKHDGIYVSPIDMIDVKDEHLSVVVCGNDIAGTRFKAPLVIEPDAKTMIDMFKAGLLKRHEAHDIEPLYIRNTVVQGGKRG